MVGDEQLGPFGDGFLGGSGERIHGEEHGVHGGGGATRDETGGVPAGGKLRREERMEGVDDVCEGGGCEFFSHTSIVAGGAAGQVAVYAKARGSTGILCGPAVFFR